MVADRIACDVHRIEPVDPYPHEYEQTVELNRREQREAARPAIANRLRSLAGYDVVLLASPVWNSSAPMIMWTFAERLDFAGTRVHPITTHTVSGLGSVPDDYEYACRGATLGEGLAVRGEEVRDAGAAVDSWLQRTGLL